MLKATVRGRARASLFSMPPGRIRSLSSLSRDVIFMAAGKW